MDCKQYRNKEELYSCTNDLLCIAASAAQQVELPVLVAREEEAHAPGQGIQDRPGLSQWPLPVQGRDALQHEELFITGGQGNPSVSHEHVQHDGGPEHGGTEPGQHHQEQL